MSNEWLQTISNVAIAIGGIIAILGGFGSYYFGKQVEKEKEAAAAIETKKQATAGRVMPAQSISGLILSIGTARIKVRRGRPFELTDGQDRLLSIREQDGKVLVSVKVFDESGALLAELKDNEWSHQIRPAIFDRNYNDNVIEIRDKTGW